jgi:hypothetical protein
MGSAIYEISGDRYLTVRGFLVARRRWATFILDNIFYRHSIPWGREVRNRRNLAVAARCGEGCFTIGFADFRHRAVHPADRSDSRCPSADRSVGAPPSTSLFAIRISPVTGITVPRHNKALCQALSANFAQRRRHARARPPASNPFSAIPTFSLRRAGRRSRWKTATDRYC